MDIISKLKKMSEKTETIVFSKAFSEEQMTKIKEGFHPKSMEQRFFIHFSNSKLFIHSLRSKSCIFIANFHLNEIISLIICRDKSIYDSDSLELDIWNFESIIDGLFKDVHDIN